MHALIVFPVSSLTQDICCIQVGIHICVPHTYAVDAVSTPYAGMQYAAHDELDYICAVKQVCCIPHCELGPDLQAVAVTHA